uniref:Secreted protein n=1 Tax=Haemonchus placei TaxID=6290 RepID=A0A0N4XA02_HAEPC
MGARRRPTKIISCLITFMRPSCKHTFKNKKNHPISIMKYWKICIKITKITRTSCSFSSPTDRLRRAIDELSLASTSANVSFVPIRLRTDDNDPPLTMSRS